MKNKSMIAAIIILCFIIVISLLSPFISPYDPQHIDMTNRLSYPTKEHLLGTDSLGRDTLSRIMYGGRKSILLAFLATILSMMIGIIIGFFSGYYGGKVDMIITTASNVFLGMPGISIMIAFAGVLGPSMKSLLIAIVVNSWVGFSRIIRGEVMDIKNEYFIEGLKSLGANDFWIFIRHILPNLSDSLIILFVSRIGSVILSVAALSYLGLGLQPPEPDWAVMISDARSYFRSYPMLALAPGTCIVVFVWCVYIIGDYIRDKLDVNGGVNDKL